MDFAGFTNDISGLLQPGALASLLAAVAAFATVITLALPALKGDRLEPRLKAVTQRREQLRKQSRARLDEAAERRLRRDNTGLMSEVRSTLGMNCPGRTMPPSAVTQRIKPSHPTGRPLFRSSLG